MEPESIFSNITSGAKLNYQPLCFIPKIPGEIQLLILDFLDYEDFRHLHLSKKINFKSSYSCIKANCQYLEKLIAKIAEDQLLNDASRALLCGTENSDSNASTNSLFSNNLQKFRQMTDSIEKRNQIHESLALYFQDNDYVLWKCDEYHFYKDKDLCIKIFNKCAGIKENCCIQNGISTKTRNAYLQLVEENHLTPKKIEIEQKCFFNNIHNNHILPIIKNNASLRYLSLTFKGWDLIDVKKITKAAMEKENIQSVTFREKIIKLPCDKDTTVRSISPILKKEFKLTASERDLGYGSSYLDLKLERKVIWDI